MDENRFRADARRALRTGKIPANPKMFGISGVAKKELITGGDQRLAQAVRQDALGASRVDNDSN